jgi:uncharacterized protein (TIGR02646 family)
MRNIQKSHEPRSLTEHRCNTSSDYDNFADKDALRASLVAEQKGICCYCTQRIHPDLSSMKIEHWQCQERYPDRQLEYKNLLAACKGGEGQKPAQQHCDTKKGNADLSFNPADFNHDVESKIKFLGNGEIKSINPHFDREINENLNLNQRTLVNNRKSILDAFHQKFMNTNPSIVDLQKELAKWNGDSGQNLEPFCQVVIYYLRKKISRVQPGC